MTLLFRDATDLTTCSSSSDFLLKCFDCFQNGMEMRCEGNRNPSACPSVRFSKLVLMQFISLDCIVEFTYELMNVEIPRGEFVSL